MNDRNLWPAVAVAAAFIILAIGGGIFTAHQMNSTADTHNISAGRSGDPRPIDASAQPPTTAGPTTTGQGADSSVPPASR